MKTEQKQEEEVVFESAINNDELAVAEATVAETDIKTTLNGLDVIDGKEKKYDIEDVDKDFKTFSNLNKQIKKLASEESTEKEASDGSTAGYYELPDNAEELQDLISFRNMNAQMGEVFRECYRYGMASHCDKMRGAKKIKFYIDAEIARMEQYDDDK